MIFLLVPEASTQKHLEILSEIAEMLSDSSLRERLKTVDSGEALHRTIATWTSVQPA
jgi:PTS system nitrogen regulatory IIA component